MLDFDSESPSLQSSERIRGSRTGAGKSACGGAQDLGAGGAGGGKLMDQGAQ